MDAVNATGQGSLSVIQIVFTSRADHWPRGSFRTVITSGTHTLVANHAIAHSQGGESTSLSSIVSPRVALVRVVRRCSHTWNAFRLCGSTSSYAEIALGTFIDWGSCDTRLGASISTCALSASGCRGSRRCGKSSHRALLMHTGRSGLIAIETIFTSDLLRLITIFTCSTSGTSGRGLSRHVVGTGGAS